MLGKSNTPEFGITCVTESELNGDCRNPWDTDVTPGGSSGGAAAAVAAGVLPLAHGSDGGGSIRIPASCCGLFGLKPSRGRVSPAPWVSGSLELGRRAAGISVTRPRRRGVARRRSPGYEPGDAHWAPPPERPFLDEVGADPGRLRIAFTAEPPIPYPVDPRVAAVARDAADALSALGHDVVERTPAWQDDALLAWFARLWQVGAGAVPGRGRLAADAAQPRARRGRARDVERRLSQAVTALQRLARRVVAFWDDVDVVLTPTLALLPVPIGWVFEPDDPWEQFWRGAEFTPFTPIVNVTGQPAMSVPFDVADGLPVGVHLIGPPAGEAMLFRLAAQLEAAHPWADRLPFASARALSVERRRAPRVRSDHEQRVVARDRADDERMAKPVDRARDRRRRSRSRSARPRRSARRSHRARTARAASAAFAADRLGGDGSAARSAGARADRRPFRARARGCRARPSPA